MIRLPIALLLMVYATAEGQKIYALKDLFTDSKVVWYGIDYTHAEMVGNFTNKDLHDYFHGWNKLIIQESGKYNIAKALQRNQIIFGEAYIEQLNNQSTPTERTIPSDSSLRKSEIANMIAEYKSNHSDGIGLVFIAERYYKVKNTASHYIVFFDIATKKILISQRYTTAPDGIGIRNFWAASIRTAIKLMASNYKKWKKKYAI